MRVVQPDVAVEAEPGAAPAVVHGEEGGRGEADRHKDLQEEPQCHMIT